MHDILLFEGMYYASVLKGRFIMNFQVLKKRIWSVKHMTHISCSYFYSVFLIWYHCNSCKWFQIRHWLTVHLLKVALRMRLVSEWWPCLTTRRLDPIQPRGLGLQQCMMLYHESPLPSAHYLRYSTSPCSFSLVFCFEPNVSWDFHLCP